MARINNQNNAINKRLKTEKAGEKPNIKMTNNKAPDTKIVTNLSANL